MKKWLTSLFLLLALAGGVLAGTPMHSGNTNSRMSCCKKMKGAEQTPHMKMVNLCCVLNCTDPAPSPTGPSFNFSPANITVSDSIIKQIASLLMTTEKPVSTTAVSFERANLPRKIPPKYLRHHSFLI
jgi:hypothetical protein